MAVVSTNDLKRGMSLDLPDGLFQVVDFQHVKPGKGGAFVRTTLKNLRNGATIDKTFRGDEKVEQAVIDKRDMQFLYKDGSDFVFMDNESYDQLHVPPASLADAANYIVDGSTVTLQMYGTEIVGSDLPAAVELTVARDRAGRAGRPRVGRPQARHPRDRPGPPGAAVREPGRPHQGRHPLGRVHHPRVSLAQERRDARERALGLLYEAETKGCTGAERAGRPARARRRVRRRPGDRGRRAPGAIDGLLTEHAKGWTLARMPALDRAALRMGTAELITRADVPTAVVLNETVELASRFSTDDSGRFVNGLLAKIATEVRGPGDPLPDPPLRSGDLLLRPWQVDDAPALVAAWADPEIQRWTGCPTRRDLARGRAVDRRRRGAAAAGPQPRPRRRARRGGGRRGGPVVDRPGRRHRRDRLVDGRRPSATGRRLDRGGAARARGPATDLGLRRASPAATRPTPDPSRSPSGPVLWSCSDVKRVL